MPISSSVTANILISPLKHTNKHINTYNLHHTYRTITVRLFIEELEIKLKEHEEEVTTTVTADVTKTVTDSVTESITLTLTETFDAKIAQLVQVRQYKP